MVVSRSSFCPEDALAPAAGDLGSSSGRTRAASSPSHADRPRARTTLQRSRPRVPVDGSARQRDRERGAGGAFACHRCSSFRAAARRPQPGGRVRLNAGPNSRTRCCRSGSRVSHVSKTRAEPELAAPRRQRRQQCADVPCLGPGVDRKPDARSCPCQAAMPPSPTAAAASCSLRSRPARAWAISRTTLTCCVYGWIRQVRRAAPGRVERRIRASRDGWSRSRPRPRSVRRSAVRFGAARRGSSRRSRAPTAARPADRGVVRLVPDPPRPDRPGAADRDLLRQSPLRAVAPDERPEELPRTSPDPRRRVERCIRRRAAQPGAHKITARTCRRSCAAARCIALVREKSVVCGSGCTSCQRR